jgi:peptidoglycan/LPS O-acetylase OafA/YrhL
MSTRSIRPDASPCRAAPLDAPPWLEGGRIPSLDGLRAVAILLVLLCHWHFPHGGSSAVEKARGQAGDLGVQLFFVISGFLITTLMLREVRRTGRLDLRHFYLRRFLRIVPVYLAYLAVLALLQAAGPARLTGRHWLGLATYTVNFLGAPPDTFHVWSLCVEEHFYLLWPLLLAAFPVARCRRLALYGLVGAFALRWLALLLLRDPGFINRWTFTRLDDIAAGCLLAFLVHDPVWRGRLDRLVHSARGLALVLLVPVAAHAVSSSLVGPRLSSPALEALLVSLRSDVSAAAFAVFLWAAVTRPGSWGGRLLNYRAVVVIGVLSYSLYLWHPLFVVSPSPLLLSFPLNFVCSFLVAGLSYVLIEKPFLSLKDRLSAGTRRPATVEAAPPVVAALPGCWEGADSPGEPAALAAG